MNSAVRILSRKPILRNFVKAKSRKLSTRPKVILGIETSCDDTAVAIVDSERNILSDVISSQWDIHQEWKGIVPMLAARAHTKNLPFVIEQAFQQSGLTSWKEIDGVAVTSGPGLPPCLVAGLKEAKRLSSEHDLPLISVNHLEAHALVARLQDDDLQFPFMVLLVSGGHCQLLLAKGVGHYVELGGTVDDSIGEAFDKVARMVGIFEDDSGKYAGKHGGSIIEELALEGDASQFRLTEPMTGRKNCDFSFSGTKTAVLRELKKVDIIDDIVRRNMAACFQHIATKHLITRTRRAWQRSKDLIEYKDTLENLVVCGGVASNNYIREKLMELGENQGFNVRFPPPRYCTDNGVMVAWAGLERYMLGIRDVHENVDIRARFPLSELDPVAKD